MPTKKTPPNILFIAIDDLRHRTSRLRDDMLFDPGKCVAAHNVFFCYTNGTNRNALKT